MEQTIEIPADVKTVTLELKKQCGFTLRSLLPQVKGEVELVVEDEFDGGRDCDWYRLRANSGNSLLHKLMRSRVVEGESLLDLTPSSLVSLKKRSLLPPHSFGPKSSLKLTYIKLPLFIKI